VLGATGFIGSYVSRALRRAGFDVVQGGYYVIVGDVRG